MGKNRNALLLIVLVIVVALVIFNFERFTGGAVKRSVSKIYVSTDPDIKSELNPTLKAGQKVYFTVETGREGCKRTVNIYEEDKSPLRVASVELEENCGGRKCRPNRATSADYRTWSSWKGKYCGAIEDLLINEEVKACFTII